MEHQVIVFRFVGVLLVLAGIASGLYAGVWFAFIGGIVDVITAVKADVTVPLDVAIGVAKIMFAGLIGWLSAACLVIPGVALVNAK